jgi:pimeloyl-ACP methyl ester carboxylesterase
LNTKQTPEALLLIPGMMCDERLWRHQSAAMESRCSEIKIADVSTGDTIEQIAASILKSAPERFSLAGFSMGGIVALEIMRQVPGRVSRLALLDTTARNETLEQQAPRLAQMELVREGQLRELMFKELVPSYLGKAQQDDTFLRWEILNMALLNGQDVFLRQCTALNTRMDYRETLSSIRCPSLVLCGREEKICPVWMHEEMAKAISGSELVIIENAGHFAPMEAPEDTTAAMLEWLGRSA